MIITQPKNGYRYNSDTMFLYDFIREGGVRGEVLEVGCGSGVLGLLLHGGTVFKMGGVSCSCGLFNPTTCQICQIVEQFRQFLRLDKLLGIEQTF